MSHDRLKDARPYYDVVVIGSGLAGLTAANYLGKCGRSVLLLEQHYNFGGMATWFRRKNGHIFDISLHGFPIGMIKSCRKYWTREIADSIVQLKGIRFDNPQFSLGTTFDRIDFTRLLTDRFGVSGETVERFFDAARAMDFYDDQTMTTRELFEQFFPGRTDVWRLLMEPIAYANGSTLDDPAITYGIVFSNFMSKGVYIFRGGTDVLIRLMKAELKKNGVDIRHSVPVERIRVAGGPLTNCAASPLRDAKRPRFVKGGRAIGVVADGRLISCGAVLSNANLKTTIEKLVGYEHFSDEFVHEARAVRLNNSSCQVYMGLRHGEKIDYIGDLLFTSVDPQFDSGRLCAKDVTSRTFSMYYPDIRPGSDRYAIVSSTNANWSDWAHLPKDEYDREKQHLIDTTVTALEKYIPDIRGKLEHVEASTPRTFQRYTLHAMGATFGTKFEGLKVSMDLPGQIAGLFHAGSVGIIMSGWLGAINYGVIVANELESFLSHATPRPDRGIADDDVDSFESTAAEESLDAVDETAMGDSSSGPQSREESAESLSR
ncbi:MAG: FAD-dependent oxidoreductase [Phycisphaerales bacterium]|nr:FAD-dependent oxidoreductase [Phycisphaerales bacterium]